ncbi:MAG: class I SAM-dependent RNA methyltransferase [Alphaproteobacteria bacterium]
MPVARIESLAYGPHGVARVDGKVHFVRGVAPGDVVEIEVREDRGSFAWADVVRVVEPGPARRDPPCEYLPRCGGCPWQQVVDDEQARAKEAIVRDLLARVGGLDSPEVQPILRPAPAFGYRRRLSMRVEERRVGFLEAASHDLVPIERCLLAAPELDGAIVVAQAWVESLRTRLNRLEIASVGPALDAPAGKPGAAFVDVPGPGRFVLVGQADGAYAAEDDEASRRLLASEPRVAGVVIHGRGFRRVAGDDRVRAPLGPRDVIELRAGDFTQVGDAGNAALVDCVVEAAAARPGDVVADLYAGAGNLAIPLARRGARVFAVERSRSSVAAGRANASRLGLADLSFEDGDVPRVLDDWITRGRSLDAAVLDPPRSGAADAVSRLLRIAPRTIVYVSCDPSTLARDLRALSSDYRMIAAQPLEFFPQTHHVETVARLVRR